MSANPARADVMLYVQHLLGTGHLQRAAAIARAAAAGGLDTVLVSGGLPLAGLDAGGARLVQLEPVRARDETFSELVDAAGASVDDAFKVRRTQNLIDVFEATRPRILMTELFPFGRRQMRFEVSPLLERALARADKPAILCSLRDVLTTHKQPGKTEWMMETFARYYDLALVHGDPDLIPLEASFPSARAIADRLRYTGYVMTAAPVAPQSEPSNGGEILVSTGGGAVAGPLLEAAMAARALTPLADSPWRFLIGANYPEDAFRDLRSRAPRGVVVERARPDFTALLSRARLSISQGGYNTTLEVLAAKVPAVIVPFSARGETEQGLRARVLAERGLISLVDEAVLTPEAVAAGVAHALSRPPQGLAEGLNGIAVDGAAETVRLLRSLRDCG